jgi:hypothetical protein
MLGIGSPQAVQQHVAPWGCDHILVEDNEIRLIVTLVLVAKSDELASAGYLEVAQDPTQPLTMPMAQSRQPGRDALCYVIVLRAPALIFLRQFYAFEALLP